MSDDDPFADLGQTLDDANEHDDSASSRELAETTADSTSEQSVTQDEDNDEDRDPTEDTAFSYEAAKQRPFYARDDTIEDFDAWLNYELERELSIRGYQNIVVREMTDALLRTVVEEDLVEEVTERFEQARNSAISESGE